MEKENQRVTITKQLLKSALVRLMKKKSVDKISIMELCREAGINRATFYRHYEIPRDVLVEMEQDLFLRSLEEIKKPSSLEDVYRYLEDMCLFLKANSEILEALIIHNSDMLFINVLSDICEKAIGDLTQIDAFREFGAEGMKILCLYYSGGSYCILRKWLMGELEKTPREMAAMAYSLLLDTDWRETIIQLSKMQNNKDCLSQAIHS